MSSSHRLNINPIRWSLKTVGGLLLVVIACLVVGMLGYHAYEGFSVKLPMVIDKEGLTPTHAPRRIDPRRARITRAEMSAGPATANRHNANARVDTSSGLTYSTV